MLPSKNLSIKRSFLLLEVLIALAILSLCLTPLVRIPYLAIKKNREAFARMEIERISNLAFAEAKALLYGAAFPWDEVKNGLSKPLQCAKGVWQCTNVKEKLLRDGKKAKYCTIRIILHNDAHPKEMRSLILE